jgi:hypothetical protein
VTPSRSVTLTNQGRHLQVTFTLTGFASVRCEGIELTGAFVATINADLRVGTVQETITVTGETPLVDVQSSRVQQTLKRTIRAASCASRSRRAPSPA